MNPTEVARQIVALWLARTGAFISKDAMEELRLDIEQALAEAQREQGAA